MGKSFIDEFEVKEEKFEFNDIPDYEAFANKELLDELRNKIIQNLIDHNTNNEIGINSYVRKEIDKVLEGYDLSVVERSYINNLIKFLDKGILDVLVPVEINGKEYLDGGIVDAVPIKYFESIGYTKNIVILTRPYDYVKKKGRFNWIMKFFLRKYPAVYEGMKNRHKMYSETMEYINQKEKSGEILVVRPEFALNVKRTERNPG